MRIETQQRGSSPQRHRRRWLMRLLSVVLGLAMIGAVELLLRACSIGDPSLASDPYVGFAGTRPLFVLDDDGERYTIPESRQTFFRPDSFDAKKSPEEVRIFVLGGSTVQGRPFSIETSFTTWLGLSLQSLQPRRDWQVVNCGGVSYASYRLVPIMEETLAHEPDLFIIYTGHNEFLEDRSYAHIRQAADATANNIGLLAKSRIFGLMSTAWRSNRERSRPPATTLNDEVDALLDYRGGLEKYHRDDAWHEGVVSHFEYNLRRMIAMADRADVPVILAIPVSNLKDSPPFKMEHGEALTSAEKKEIDELWAQAKALPSEQVTKARQLLQRALDIDDRHAGLWFHLGKCLEAEKKYDAAKAAYTRAKDEDICPLRAIESQLQVIRRVAKETKTPLVDIGLLIENNSPNGIPGSEMLVDHVHPSIHGHQLIAEHFVEKMSEHKMIDVDDDWRTFHRSGYAAHLRSLSETYFARGKERLDGLKKWSEGRVSKLREDDR